MRDLVEAKARWGKRERLVREKESEFATSASSFVQGRKVRVWQCVEHTALNGKSRASLKNFIGCQGFPALQVPRIKYLIERGRLKSESGMTRRPS